MRNPAKITCCCIVIAIVVCLAVRYHYREIRLAKLAGKIGLAESILDGLSDHPLFDHASSPRKLVPKRSSTPKLVPKTSFDEDLTFESNPSPEYWEKRQEEWDARQ